MGRLSTGASLFRWSIGSAATTAVSLDGDAGVPRYGTDRSFAGFVGTAVDVTDRKLVELALLESHAALKERTLELERRTTQLSQMASDLTLAEQRARAGLARTLHDGLQQLLVIAAINVDELRLAGSAAGNVGRRARAGAETTSTRQSRPRAR